MNRHLHLHLLIKLSPFIIPFLEFNPCRDGEYYCRDSNRCLTQDLICDGCVDCFDVDQFNAEEGNCPSKYKIKLY